MSDAQNLTGLLEKIRGNLDQNSYGNEAAVRQSIIEPHSSIFRMGHGKPIES